MKNFKKKSRKSKWSKNIFSLTYYRIQSELQELKDGNDARIKDILADHWKLTQTKLNEFRREIMESKEYIN
jgi:hypothetical protein